MGKRILIATGGTGGHIHPAQGLAARLTGDPERNEVALAGKGLVGSPYLNSNSHPLFEIESAPVAGGSILKMIGGVGKLSWGVIQGLRTILKWKPDVVVGFGSYHSAPVLAAALLTRTPIVLHEANCIPGKVVRLFAPWAKVTGTHFPIEASSLSGRTVEVGMPLRPGYQRSESSVEEARRHFGLSDGRLTLLAFGGSQGAFAVNTLVCNAVVDHLARRSTRFQVIHVTGNTQLQPRIEQAYQQAGITAYVTGYEERMDLAWRAADLFIGRAGAGSLAEMLEMEVPGILIPYPLASDQHQEKNAYYASEVIGGALTREQSQLTPAQLAEDIRSLLADDHSKLNEMRTALRRYKEHHHPTPFTQLILETLGTQLR